HYLQDKLLILNKQIQASYAASSFIKKGVDIFKSTLVNFYFVSCWYRYLKNDFLSVGFLQHSGKGKKITPYPKVRR
ncbi:MAG: hypothetical protein RR848_02430, partial [Oscillospiraceae bacterium]